MNKKGNKKATFTKTQLANTLFSLLDKFSYQDITILEICQYSEISRASFYRNFKSKDEVMAYYISSIIKKKIPDENSEKRMFFKSSESLDIWFNEQDLLKKLYENDIFYLLTNELSNIISNAFEKRYSSEDDPYYDYLSSEMAYIISSIFYKWAQRDFKENKKELTDLLERLHLSRSRRELLPKEKR